MEHHEEISSDQPEFGGAVSFLLELRLVHDLPLQLVILIIEELF